MTATAQYGICRAVAALLAATPSLGAGTVKVQRRRPMAQAVASQVFVYYDDSQPTLKTSGSIVWKTRVRIECVARDAAGVTADAASDALVEAAYARVMATWPTMAGAATAIEPLGLASTGDEADTSLSAGQLLFDISHRCPMASVS